MPITIGPSKNYPSPLNALPTKLRRSPPESDKMIALEIDWGSMGQSVAFNLADNSTLTFSQLVSLVVDNSQCGADVRFTFPDTADIVTIPAYSPRVIVPVFTNQLFFYAATIGGESEDVTRVQLLNFVPPPIAVPVTSEQEAAVISGLNIATSGSRVLLPATINGTLEGLFIQTQGAATTGNSSTVTWMLEDGTGAAIANGIITNAAGTQPAVISFDNPNMRVRFQDGLNFVVVAGPNTATSLAYINLYYRTP